MVYTHYNNKNFTIEIILHGKKITSLKNSKRLTLHKYTNLV